MIATYTAEDNEGNSYLMGFFAEQRNTNWVWRQLTTLQGANWSGILIGVEVDPGHPNDHEPGYRNFVFNHTNFFLVSGAMAHAWIRYGRTFVPEMVNAYYRINPQGPLTLGVGHLFYHHQQEEWPRELYDESIPVERRREILYEFIDTHLIEVFDVIAPLLRRYSSLRVQATVANEAIWEYNGNTGWEGEYSEWAMYDILGKSWAPEVYVRFESIRQRYNIPRDRFILLMNDWGIELPGLKTEYFLSQRRWVINEIARRMGISPNDVQLDIGIQYGLEPLPANLINYSYVNEYYIKRSVLYLDKSPSKLLDNLEIIAREGNLYITEAHGEPRIMVKAFRLWLQSEGLRESLKMINFWDALNRGVPGSNSIVNKTDYSPNFAYYNLLYLLLHR